MNTLEHSETLKYYDGALVSSPEQPECFWSTLEHFAMLLFNLDFVNISLRFHVIIALEGISNLIRHMYMYSVHLISMAPPLICIIDAPIKFVLI